MISLITGASSGIGLELAMVLARENWDIVLVARNKEKLEELKEKLLKINKNIKVWVKPYDLAKRESIGKLYEELKSEGLEIELLVNNAGIGVFGEFSETSLEKELNMIDLNMTSLTILTKLFLKDMLKKDSGKILNVASTASFQSGPLMGVYYATKAYVLNLSEAIAEEISDSNVSITVLCPGPTRTNFEKMAHLEESKLFKNFHVAKASDVAEYGYRALMEGKLIAIHGIFNKILYYFGKFMPRKLKRKMVKKIQEKK